MPKFQSLLLCLPLSLLGGCATVSDYLNPELSQYCDNFLVYDMCVRDMDRDGVAEFIYFQESNEVFLYREGALGVLPGSLGVHVCAQMMDPNLVATTSRMLLIDDETSFLERTDIRGALLLRYMALMPTITECQLTQGREAVASESDS